MEYKKSYETLYQVTPELSGYWSGHINISGHKIAAQMNFTYSGKIYLELEDQRKTEVSNAVFNTVKMFKGNFNGYLPVAEANPNNSMNIKLRLMNVSLKLLLKDRRLFGSLAASFSKNDDNYLIQGYIALKKNKLAYIK